MNGYTTYIWAFLASIIAIGLEVLYKKRGESWIFLLPFTIAPMLLMSYLLSKLIRSSESILSAFIVFSFCNITLRIASTLFILNSHVSKGTWVALVLLFMAQAAKLFIK